MKSIVFNAEPLDYSPKAVSIWEECGLCYYTGSWEEIFTTGVFDNVKVLIVRLANKVTDKVLEKFPNLEILVSATTGWDHIDLEAIKNRKIELISLRGHNDFLDTIPSTAEHTWALLMSLFRNIPAADNDVRAGIWERDKFRGYQMAGKTIGIVGMGRTGKKVARYAEAFGMVVKYYDPYLPEYNGLFSEDSLVALVEKSNILSLHVHLNEETKHLISSEVLGKLKIGSYLINTSRGLIVNEDCLEEFFVNKKIAGLAADVLANEFEDIKTNILWKLQNKGYNVVLTPHIGGATFDAMHSCEEFVANLFRERIRQ